MKPVLIALISCYLISCSSQAPIASYKDNAPQLVASEFFNGQLYAVGIVKNRSGKVIRRFEAGIDAHWNNGVGTLDEHFVFDDGEKQRRIWTLNPVDNKAGPYEKYIGTANDVQGQAIISIAGNAMFLKYTLMVPYKGKELAITVDDKMYLVNPDTIINESVMYKFGFKVGSITLTIQRRPTVN